MEQKLTSSKKVNYLLLISVLGFISGFIAFGYMGSFIRIIGDDYFYAASFSNHGFWGGQIHSYMNHTLFHGNRYTLNFYSHFFSLFPPSINAVLPSIIIISFITALYSLFSNFFRRLDILVSIFVRLALSMIVAFFTLWLAPTVKQGLYWRSSMLPSFGPIIGVLFLSAFILLKKRVKWYSCIITFIFSLINAGLSENGAAYQLMTVGIIFVFSFWARDKQFQDGKRLMKLSAIAAAGSICGTIIMWLSPGIAIQLEKASTSILNTAILSALHAYNHYKEMVLSRFSHLLIILLLGFITFFIIFSQNKFRNITKGHNLTFWIFPILIIQIITFFLITSLTFPSAFTRNAYPDPRHFMGSILIIVIAFLSSGFILGGFLFSLLSKNNTKLVERLSTVALLVFTIISIAYPIWTIPQITSENLKFKYWATQWDRRHQRILGAKKQGSQEIHVLRMDHIIEGVAELGPKSSDPYYNLSASQYYGIEIFADQPGWDEGFRNFLQNH